MHAADRARLCGGVEALGVALEVFEQAFDRNFVNAVGRHHGKNGKCGRRKQQR